MVAIGTEHEILKLHPRLVMLVGILLSVCALAYLVLLDHGLYTTRHFAPIFAILLAVYDPYAALLGVLVCMAAAFWARPESISRVMDALTRFPGCVALACTALFACGALFVYRNYPFSMDEYAAVFQAKIFASGHLFARLPPALLDWLVVPGFNGAFLVASPATGHAIEGYWPGFALLLAPFEYLHAPWLCNAVLGGIAIRLVFLITLEVTGEPRAATWAMLFAFASSAFDANAISYYSMQAHLTLNLLYAWLLLQPTAKRALAAGVVGSFALILHNPFPHTMFAIPWIVALAADRERRLRLVPLFLGYIPIFSVAAIGWLMLRYQILSISSLTAGGNPVPRVFSWPDAIIANMRAAALVKMWVWAVPGLFVFAFVGWMRFRNDRRVNLMALSAALTFVGYLFVKLDQGHGWGYRYFHSAWGVIPVLAGCAMAGNSPDSRRLQTFAGACAILSVLLLVPLQMFQIHSIISRHLAQVQPPRRPGNNVYFLNPYRGFYVSDMIQIDPSLRDKDLYLATRGDSMDAQLIRQNWPGAVRIRANLWSQQWYLGPVDHRVTVPGDGLGPHFVLKFSPPPP